MRSYKITAMALEHLGGTARTAATTRAVRNFLRQ
jgi:hypothetical protein